MIDEKKAFRQVPVLPSHRRLAAVAAKKEAVGVLRHAFPPVRLDRKRAKVQQEGSRSHLGFGKVVQVPDTRVRDGSGNTKTRQGMVVNLLGIAYNFKEGLLMVTEMWMIAITFEIIDNLAQPGAAAKLRGRLGFVASHLSGCHGRPFLLALSERQYSRAGTAKVTEPTRRALKMWLLF